MGSFLMLLYCYEEHGEALEMLQEMRLWSSTITHTPESKAESMTWNHPHSPAKKKFKTMQFQRKVMTALVWDVHRVLLFDFTPPGSKVNEATYQETLK
jgi:hypothetical protein